jgi:hypothetical protein
MVKTKIEHFIHSNGREEYYQNGKRHRIDGPAVIYSDGRTEYWINDKRQD